MANPGKAYKTSFPTAWIVSSHPGTPRQPSIPAAKAPERDYQKLSSTYPDMLSKSKSSRDSNVSSTPSQCATPASDYETTNTSVPSGKSQKSSLDASAPDADRSTILPSRFPSPTAFNDFQLFSSEMMTPNPNKGVFELTSTVSSSGKRRTRDRLKKLFIRGSESISKDEPLAPTTARFTRSSLPQLFQLSSQRSKARVENKLVQRVRDSPRAVSAALSHSSPTSKARQIPSINESPLVAKSRAAELMFPPDTTTVTQAPPRPSQPQRITSVDEHNEASPLQTPGSALTSSTDRGDAPAKVPYASSFYSPTSLAYSASIEA